MSTEFDSDAVVAYGLPVSSLAVPHVDSMRLVCDECGEPIWMSKEVIDKMSNVLAERPQATISYQCIDHLEQNRATALSEGVLDIIEYGCPNASCSFIAKSQQEVADHFFAVHYHH